MWMDLSTEHLLEEPRVCYMMKWDDLGSYGFHLCSNKTKPGHYVGQVEIDTPAQLAGLRPGDRIIGVNGLPVGDMTQDQVLAVIQSRRFDVSLLVVGQETSVPEVASMLSYDSTTVVEGSSASSPASETNNGNDNVQLKQSVVVAGPNTSTPVAIEDSSNSKKGDEQEGEAMDQENTNRTNNSFEATSITYKNIPFTISPPIRIASSVLHGQNMPDIKNMTVSEFRAFLARKKKYDPKSDTIDMQMKSDILKLL